MKTFQLILLVLIQNTSFAQTQFENEESMKSTLWLNICDYKNSTLPLDSIGYGDLPKEIEYRGIIVEAVKWTDASGVNILLLTQTGGFHYKDTTRDLLSRSEIYSYLFQKKSTQKYFQLGWKLTDFQICYGVDMYAGFYRNSLTITDLDKNNLAEITFIYKLSCRGGVDAATQKLALYENNEKYMFRGETLLPAGDPKINATNNYKADEKFKSKPLFEDFAKKRWSTIGVDDFKQFR